MIIMIRFIYSVIIFFYMQIKIDEIKELAIKVAMKHGLSQEDSEIVVEEYLDGELRGRECHGFSMFPKFAVKIMRAKKGDSVVEKEDDSYMMIKGNGNLGQVVCAKFIPQLIHKTKKKGIAMMGIYDMGSYMMPGTYARKIAENNLIGLFFNYGGWERIAPTGSIDPMFGTNPIAVGIPAKDDPIVVDMSTSKYAMGKVRLADRLGEKLPEGVAIDKDGNATIDPKKAMDGALLPIGEHKGYGLALVIEILSRCLLDVHRKDDEIYRGYFFIAIDPSKFIEIGKFLDNVKKLKKRIKSSRKEKGIEEIFLPGERSERTKRENLKKGSIEIDERIIDDIKKLLE
jgi:L-2-hydroxycarboxylate dehydrogenase (NAD+)